MIEIIKRGHWLIVLKYQLVISSVVKIDWVFVNVHACMDNDVKLLYVFDLLDE